MHSDWTVMSYRTDETTLPTSSLDSGSDTDFSHSMTSSLEHDQQLAIKDLHFLNNSWPFLDKGDNQLSFDNSFTLSDGTFDSWKESKDIFNVTDGIALDRSYCGDKSQRNSRQSSSRVSGRKGLGSSWNSSGSSPDATTLYSFRGTHYNPSGSGQRTCQELEDYTHWVNSYLGYSRSAKRSITNLTKSLADGQTLLDLVEVLLGTIIPPVHVKPALHVQKTENIQICLDMLKVYGVPLRDDITTEDIVKGNAKIVLALCQCLRKHFGSVQGKARPLDNDRGQSTSPGQLFRSSSSPIGRPLDNDRFRSTSPGQSPRASSSPIGRPLDNDRGRSTSPGQSFRASSSPIGRPLDNERGRSTSPDQAFRLSSSPIGRPPQSDHGRYISSSVELYRSSISPISRPSETDHGRYTSSSMSHSLNSLTIQPPNSDQGRHINSSGQLYRSTISPTSEPLDADCGRYTSSPNDQGRYTPRTSSSTTNRPPDTDHGRYTSSSNKSPRSVAVDMEDIALLNWVANMTNQTINGYQSLQDGHVLCLLVNKLTDGAVPDIVLEYGLPSEKISLALTFVEEELGLTTELTQDDVLHLTDTAKLTLLLRELHKIFLEQKQKEQADVEMAKVQQLVKQDKRLNTKRLEKIEKAFLEDIKNEQAKLVEQQSSEDDRNGASTLLENPLSGLLSERVGDESTKYLLAKEKEKVHERIGVDCESHLARTELTENSNSNVNLSSLINSSQQTEYPENERDYYFIMEELKNMENKSRTSPEHNTRYYQPDKSPKSRGQRLYNDLPRISDKKVQLGTNDDIMDLLQQEMVFDPIKWQLPYQPHASKSWKKERENARVKIDHLSEQLKLLKEQYFKYMNIDIEKDKNEFSDKKKKENCDFISPERTYNTSTLQTDPSPSKSLDSPSPSSKVLARSFNSYFNKNKGTSPPYRTWSSYINTDGDRYKLFLKKKNTKTKSSANGEANVIIPGISRAAAGRAIQNQENTLGEKQFSNSPQIRQIQQAQSRDLMQKRSSDAGLSVCSADSQESSGLRLHGITAIVRLSSKKANAISDTEN